jgi:predicted nuclease of predicted toxin-antitoxin system
MRFLADENFPGVAVAALEASGHDIVWMRLATPGASDAEVLQTAARERRILLTFDKDFGELAARLTFPPSCGVVLLRVPAPNSQAAAQRVADRVGARDDWNGHFSVIEPARVRMRRLR